MKGPLSLRWICTIFLSTLFGCLASQEPGRGIDSLLSLYGETWVTVAISDRSSLNLLSTFTSVAAVDGNEALINVNRDEFGKLQKYGFICRHTPLIRPLDDALMKPSTQKGSGWDFYPTWQMYDSMMHAFEQQYPALCKTFQFLTLTSGRKLLVAKLTSGTLPPGSKPRFLYSSTMHGNETTGYILLLRLIDHLLSGYGVDTECTWFLDNMEIWVCPLANPDGTYYAGNHTVSGSIRRNANNVDLNRNYPDPRVGPHPDGNPWQPETMAFMGLADTVQFNMGANLHGGAEVVNYPWDTWLKTHPDDLWWIQTSRRYADTVQANSPSGFFNDQNNGITNGAAWYVITGGRQDYMNYFAACREVTLEVSNTMIMPAAQLNDMWNYHHRALINYVRDGWYGLRGEVTDSVTGLPLRAKVWVNAHDADSSHVYSGSLSGFYFRPINPGAYSITWSAPGYHPKTVQTSVPAMDTSVVDVQLVPVGYGVGIPAPLVPHIWYDGLNEMIVLDLHGIAANRLTVYDVAGRKLLENNNPGSQEKLALNSGVYVVEVALSDQRVIRKKMWVRNRT